MTIPERAAHYLSRLPHAIAGQGGHDATFRAACILVHGFALDTATALELLRSWNQSHCSPPWSERELQHKIKSAAGKPDPNHGWLVRDVHHRTASTGQRQYSSAPYLPHTPSLPHAAPQAPPEPRRLPIDYGAVQRALAACAVSQPTPDYLASISPADPSGVGHTQFFGALYRPNEVSLIFTSPFSQGDYAAYNGLTYRLSPDIRGKAIAAPLPPGAPKGVWFLANPTDGQWHRKPGHYSGEDQSKALSRRSESAVIAWRYLVMESDDLPPADWLRILLQLPLPIAAVYTSGGKSIHALVRVDAASKREFDHLRDHIMRVYAPLGADPAAMTAVRLTRLPGCLRGSRPQRLLYLDPDPLDHRAPDELQQRHPLR